MSGYYSAFATACGCTDNGQLLSYLAKWLGALGGTYGYYAADDGMLAQGDEQQLATYVQAIKAQDPNHMVMIGAADETETHDYQSVADVTGNDIYPVTNGSVDWSGVAQQASDDQHDANQAGKQSAFILQAFTWGDNLSDGQAIGACTASDTAASCYAKLDYPSPAQQLQMRNEILTHADPKLILWWSFPGTNGEVNGDTYSTYPDRQRRRRPLAGTRRRDPSRRPADQNHSRLGEPLRKCSEESASPPQQGGRRRQREARSAGRTRLPARRPPAPPSATATPAQLRPRSPCSTLRQGSGRHMAAPRQGATIGRVRPAAARASHLSAASRTGAMRAPTAFTSRAGSTAAS